MFWICSIIFHSSISEWMNDDMDPIRWIHSFIRLCIRCSMKMGSKWIKWGRLCIISHSRRMRWSDHVPHLPTLMLSSGITFPLASSCWIIPGTLLCYMGCSWERGMRFGNMLVDRVGMGLISLFMWCVKYVKVQFRYLMCCWGVPAADDESRMDKKM